MAAHNWRATVSPRERIQYLERALDIYRVLGDQRGKWQRFGDNGRQLLACYLGRAGALPQWEQTTESDLEAALPFFSGTSYPWLYSGWAGAGWFISHAQRQLDRTDVDCADLDDAFIELLEVRPWTHQYDLVSGAVGLGVYACESRSDRANGHRVLRAVVDCLVSCATEDSSGAWWDTAPELLPPWQRKAAPDGYKNLGVAHGIPGALWALARARRLGVSTADADRVLENGMRWLLGRAHPETKALPSWIMPDGTERPSSFSWCYGDLGTSLVLLSIGRDAGRADWEAAALEAGLREARFYQESGGARSPRDPALCHGLAGNAHLFNRLYQHTGRPEFLSVAAELFERVIRFDSGGGIAGFRAWTTMTGRESEAPPTDFDWSDDPTFLSGAAGVGLALVAAASDVTPEWDALMLVAQ